MCVLVLNNFPPAGDCPFSSKAGWYLTWATYTENHYFHQRPQKYTLMVDVVDGANNNLMCHSFTEPTNNFHRYYRHNQHHERTDDRPHRNGCRSELSAFIITEQNSD